MKSIQEGTTGKGLVFWETDESLNKQWAIWWRYRRQLSIQIDTWVWLVWW